MLGAAGLQAVAMAAALLLSLRGMRHLLGMMLQPRLASQVLALAPRLASLRG